MTAPAFAFVAPCRVDGHDIVDALGSTVVSTFNSDFGEADDAAHAALIARALTAAADPARGARIAALTAALKALLDEIRDRDRHPPQPDDCVLSASHEFEDAAAALTAMEIAAR